MRLRLLFSAFLAVCFMTASFGQTSVGIIGSATPGGWDNDTDLIQSPDSAHLWSLTLQLTAQECKFRKDDAWTVNWGSTAFPTGIGTQDGKNMVVTGAGTHDVTFNSITGAYSILVRSDIGIIGDATPAGWNNGDIDLYYDPTDSTKYFTIMNLKAGPCKFRQDNAWVVNWGNPAFPTGVGTQNGDNILVPSAGKYRIDFNKVTGEYNFTEIAEYNSIGLIGSATPTGWAADSNLVKSSSNPDLWTGTFDLVDGELKFRANDAWALSWGGGEFPSDTGVLGSPVNIKATAGKYIVSFNTKTFIYDFKIVVDYASVGLIGSATPLGWDIETPMEKVPGELGVWKKRIILKDGECKFRANNNWDVSWGIGSDPNVFPTAIGSSDPSASNIPVPEGEYVVTFNTVTGAYDFKLLVVYSTIGLIGPATPNANWEVDVDMTQDATDEAKWFIPSIDMTEGPAKFRAEDGWAVNWGLEQFPAGTGTQDGKNIPVTAGTYRVTLNTATGDYAFADPVSTIDLLSNSVISIAPNPATDFATITVGAPELQGKVNVIIINQMGQRVRTLQLNIETSAQIDISELAPGQYMMNISNEKFMVGKSLIKM